MMRPEHRGAIDILREMRYTEPQVPPTMLRKETKELFLYTEGDYIHVNEQLKILNSHLKQMYVPNNYTVKDFRSQISAFMAREVHYFLSTDVQLPQSKRINLRVLHHWCQFR